MRWTRSKFIANAGALHPTVDYALVPVRVNCHSSVTLRCKTHGITWTQRAYDHLHKPYGGCPACRCVGAYKTKRVTTPRNTYANIANKIDLLAIYSGICEVDAHRKTIAKELGVSVYWITRIARLSGWVRPSWTHYRHALRKNGKPVRTMTFSDGVPKHVLRRMRQRSREYGKPCTVTQSDLDTAFLATKGRCPLTGWSIQFVTVGGRLDPRTTASCDRINSALGYVRGNIQFIHKDVQSVKLDHTTAELLRIVTAIYEHTITQPTDTNKETADNGKELV